MPGSATTPGRLGACSDAPNRIAFRYVNGVGTRDKQTIAARWLAYACLCQRFTPHLAVRRA
jgi:TPR repeat protein